MQQLFLGFISSTIVYWLLPAAFVFRIFIPLLLIIIVAWITFFLKNYDKRIDVTTGNLLLFIAYNFSISDDLPRLGYLTFLDTILIAIFIVSTMIVVYNVYLRRLENNGKGDMAKKIDDYMIWVYPIAYALSFALVYYWYFHRV